MSRLRREEDNVSENKSTGQVQLTKRQTQSLTWQIAQTQGGKAAQATGDERRVEFQNKTGSLRNDATCRSASFDQAGRRVHLHSGQTPDLLSQKTFQFLLLYSPPPPSVHVLTEQAEIGSVLHVSGGTRAVCSDNRLPRPTSLPRGSRHPSSMDGRSRDEGADKGWVVWGQKNQTRSGFVVNTLAKAPRCFSLSFGRNTSVQCRLKCPRTSKNCTIFVGIIKCSRWTHCAQCKLQRLPPF